MGIIHFILLVAAGADIKEMQPLNFSQVYGGNFLGFWNSLALFDKPLIAAVNGFAVCMCIQRCAVSLTYYMFIQILG